MRKRLPATRVGVHCVSTQTADKHRHQRQRQTDTRHQNTNKYTQTSEDRSQCRTLSPPLLPGCLFDVVADPTEHNDLAAQEPELLTSLLAELDEQAATIWNRQMPPEDPACMAAAATIWGGFLGPYEELEGWC